MPVPVCTAYVLGYNGKVNRAAGHLRNRPLVYDGKLFFSVLVESLSVGVGRYGSRVGCSLK